MVDCVLARAFLVLNGATARVAAATLAHGLGALACLSPKREAAVFHSSHDPPHLSVAFLVC